MQLPANMPLVMGIVNITRDSFSDGGKYLDPATAVVHARQLVEDGADILDLGPASSHPDAEHVTADEEIRRLEPVIAELRGAAEISVDSFLPETQALALASGVDYLNDIEAFADNASYERLADSSCKLIAMHSVQRRGKATRVATEAGAMVDEICAFFDERFAALEAAGVARERLILDPGMGFFLGSNPEPSVEVMRAIRTFKVRFGLPVLISVSRKSFLGALTGRDTAARGPATLAAEMFAAVGGADIIRTHDVGALSDGLSVWRRLVADDTA